MPTLTLKSPAPRSAGRRGITLIELMVVLVIMSIVTAASIPLLTTGVESRRVREAARLVTSYLSAAKSRAIETGRPAGVMFQRYAGPNYALTLVGVESPPPIAAIPSLSRHSSRPLRNIASVTWAERHQFRQFYGPTPAGSDGPRLAISSAWAIRAAATCCSAMSAADDRRHSTPILINTTTNQNIGGQLLSSTGFIGIPHRRGPSAFCYLWAIDGSFGTPPPPLRATSAGSLSNFSPAGQIGRAAAAIARGTVIDL